MIEEREAMQWMNNPDTSQQHNNHSHRRRKGGREPRPVPPYATAALQVPTGYVAGEAEQAIPI